MLDSGNALFKNTGLKDADDKARAQVVLRGMGRIGVEAMAVGARDLDFGPAWLKSQAEKAKVKVLSANLVDANGKAIFPASTVITVAGKKVGVIGVSPAGPVENGAGAKGTAIAPAVLSEAKKLRKSTDAVIVLAAVPYADSLQLSRDVGSAVDFILQSHDSRGQGAMQKGEGNFILPSGERGRQLGRLSIALTGKGPFVDADELKRDEQTLKILDTQIGEVHKRLEMTPDKAAQAQLRTTLAQFQSRKQQVAARIKGSRQGGGREISLDWITLTSEFPEDAELAAEAKRIEPNGAF